MVKIFLKIFDTLEFYAIINLATKKGGPDESIYLSTEPNHRLLIRSKSMTLSIISQNDTLVVDSRLIAEELGIQHKNLIETIKKHQSTIESAFGTITFETSASKMPDGRINPNPEIFSYLNENQATLLMTFSRNTERVIQCKVDLVKAFSDAKKIIKETIVQDSFKDKATKAQVTSSLIDSIFSGVHIDKELIAGLKLNITQKQLPEVADDLELARPLLINNTAQQHELLTPSQIGEKLGISGIAVNKLLIDKGLQVKNDNKTSKKDPTYLPTDMGMEYARVTLATGKSSSDTFQQLRWYSSVLQRVI